MCLFSHERHNLQEYYVTRSIIYVTERNRMSVGHTAHKGATLAVCITSWALLGTYAEIICFVTYTDSSHSKVLQTLHCRHTPAVQPDDLTQIHALTKEPLTAMLFHCLSIDDAFQTECQLD